MIQATAMIRLRYYIDVAAYARDMELNGDVFTVEAGSEIHVFWGR